MINPMIISVLSGIKIAAITASIILGALLSITTTMMVMDFSIFSSKEKRLAKFLAKVLVVLVLISILIPSKESMMGIYPEIKTEQSKINP